MKKVMITLAIAMAACCMQAQSPVSDKDRMFVEKASQDGMMEARLGQLAQTNGASAEVKTLGQHMTEDHTKAGEELKAIASRKGIPVSDKMDAKHQQAYDKLAAKQGEEFDKAYTKCMVKDHKKAVGLFKKEAEKGSDPELTSWASKTVPTLEHHKEMSESACKAVRKK